MALGADQYEGSLPLVLNKAEKIRESKTQLTDSVGAYESANGELNTRFATMHSATEAGRQFLIQAKDWFKPRLGKKYNDGWKLTGLFGSLSIPSSAEGVQALLSSFKEFLTANADFEAGIVTAAQAGVLLTQLQNARSAVNTQRTHVTNLKADRDAKVKALRARMRNTINELASVLDKLDPKWLSFGLNMPGAPTTPDVPLNVTAVLLGTNALSVQWAQTPYASYYRIWLKIMGVNEDFLNVADTNNLEFTIQPLAAGVQVQIAVSAAVTGGGESLKSQVVTIAMPA